MLNDQLLEHFRNLETNDLTFQNGKKLFEKPIIIAALERAKGNKHNAADILGISSATLYNRMQRYGIHFDRANKRRNNR